MLKKILFMGLFFILSGCTKHNVTISTNKEIKKINIIDASYAVDNKQMYIRLGDEAQRGSNSRMQIYLVGRIIDNKIDLKSFKAYSIIYGGYYTGTPRLTKSELSIKKLKIKKTESKKYKIFSYLKTKENHIISFNLEEITLNELSLNQLLSKDIDFDKSCVLNKQFSIYTNNNIVPKGCSIGSKKIIN